MHKSLVVAKPLYWVVVATFLLHQGLQYGLRIFLPFIDSYLDPFLAPIVILGAWEYERFLLLGTKETPNIHLIEVAAVTLYVAVIGEFLFPFLSPRFYYDPFDFLAYGVGGMAYVLIFHRNA